MIFAGSGSLYYPFYKKGHGHRFLSKQLTVNEDMFIGGWGSMTSIINVTTVIRAIPIP